MSHAEVSPEVAAVYRLAGLEPPRLRRRDVSETTAITPERTLRWWRAMGFPEIAHGEVAFTETDAEMAKRLAELLERETVDEDRVLRLAHLMGASFARLAEAQLDVLEDVLTDQAPAGSTEVHWSELPVERLHAAGFVDFMSTAMDYVWRRHLVAAIGRRMVVGDDDAVQAVGFVDLSGFTKVTKRMSTEELTEVIETFEAACRDAVSAHEGRVVKFIGDGMMFVTPNVSTAVGVVMEIFGALADAEYMPPVHAGVAVGPTLVVDGDVFGPSANLASRLCDYARPGTLLMSADSAEGLEEVPDASVRRHHRRPRLKGVGSVAVVSVTPRPDEPD